MAFLKGVLSNIQSHLGQHNGQITEAIRLLETYKHAGKNGFRIAIVKVVEGVRGYNDAVAVSNKMVSDKLNSFTGELTLLKEASYKVLREQDDSRQKINYKDHHVEDATKQIDAKLKEFQRAAAQFTSDIDITVANDELKKSIVELNDKLRDKLVSVRATVAYETERLETVRAQEAKTLQSTEQSIKATIGGIQVNVNCKIDVQVKEFISKLKNKVTEISQMLQEVEKKLREHIYHLEQWINKAEAAVKAAFKQVTNILDFVNDGSTFNKVSSIYKAAEELRNQADMLFNEGMEAKKKVAETVRSALEQVKAMDDALKGDLYKVKDAVNQKVTGIKDAIGKLYKVVESGTVSDDATATQKTMVQLITHIQSKVSNISGGSTRPTEGLGGIKERGVRTYVWEFTPTQFEKNVECWLDQILGTEETEKGMDAVKSWIAEYVKENINMDPQYKKSSGTHGNYTTLNTKVKANILSKLRMDGVINKATDKYASTHEDSITANLQEVQAVCNGFANALDEKIKETNIGTFVTSIITTIHDDVKDGSIVNSENYAYSSRVLLREAVENIIIAVAAMSRQVGKELGSLLLSNRVGNTRNGGIISIAAELEKVLSITKLFDKNLRTSFGQPGTKTDHAAAVDSAIEGVNDKLREHFPADSGNQVTLNKDATFTGYNGFVDQDPKKLESLSDADSEAIKTAGSLPAAIGGIREQVQIALSSIDTFSGQVAMKYADVTNDLNNLCSAIQYAAELDPASAKTGLTRLKDTYFKEYSKSVGDADSSIKKIKHDLGELHNNLVKNPIAKVTDLLLFIERAQKHYIDELQQYLNTQVEDAKTRLTTHARKQYVDSIKSLLQAFAEKVHSELQPLPTLIDRDLEQGHKKFMQVFAGKNGYALEHIRDVISFPPAQMSDEQENIGISQEALDFANLAEKMKKYSNAIFTHIWKEINRSLKSTTADPHLSHIEQLRTALYALFNHLTKTDRTYHFDYRFVTLRDSFSSALNDLNPTHFTYPHHPLLIDSLKAGLGGLANVLDNAYVNAYSGTPKIIWVDDNDRVTETASKCAKVCLTVFHIIYSALHELDEKSGNRWRSEKINKTGNLGAFFADEGYRISNSETEQNGELDKDVNGGRVKTLLKNKVTGTSVMELLKKWKQAENKKNAVGQQTDDAARTQSIDIDTIVLLAYLYEHLRTYYDVCHRRHIPNPVAPTSVYQMLMWLSGLSHNPVNTDLSLNGFEGLFEKPEKSKSVTQHADEDSLEEEEDVSLDAYPNPITVDTLSTTLQNVCGYAETVLIALLGHGHAGGIYACDFNTNSANLSYPSDANKCLDLLMEIVLRLFHQLRFLYKQCTYPMELGGWLNCLYGKGIGGSSWECNKMQCINQSADQIGNQTCGQTCDQHPKCGVKSPLQAFLEDGLPAFLSHPYSKSGCKISCSYANHKGIPCKTPIGLTDISIMASHTSSASRLYRTLKDFCGNAASPLTKLCSNLTCVLSRPPETLGDMFAFYYTFITTWGDRGRIHKLDAFNDAVRKAHFDVPYPDLNVYSVFNGSHSSKLAGHTNGDLLSLVCGKKAPGKCGLYLSSISNDISGVYSSKYADKYLSWIVYITETFYDLLKKLFDDCNKHCGGDKPKCRIAKCPTTCTVTKQPTKSDHAESCNSIANCKTTLPTLFRYGFTIGNPSKLSGKGDVSLKRTCNDLCKMLGNVVKEGNALHKLAHQIIPDFLFKIRAPFIWLNVALWLLSLLYLLHIMVIRLDLLHIKSHLHSPSSHRIAAQSLLAAGRVNKLNRVFYLQP